MDEKGFRLDFFVAIGALLISAVTAATLAYQTHVIGNQYAATVWPYLNVNATYSYYGAEIQLENDGLGPALIRSAQLSVKGGKVPGWAGYIHALVQDPKIRPFFRHGMTISMSSVDSSMTLRAGDTKTVFAVHFPAIVPPANIAAHTLAIDFCYCSLNGNCWTLHSAPERGMPRTAHVSGCTSSAAISAAYQGPPARSPSRKD